MVKKSSIVSIALFVVFTPFAYAETNSTSDSAKPQQIKELLMQKKEVASQRKENKENLISLTLEKKEEMRAEFLAKREEFQTKLQSLRDQRKKLIVERIDKRLATINQNWAQRMTASITKLEALLEKFSARVDTLKTEGEDTTEAETKIAEAESAIQAAKDAVETQEAKEYVADLTDEAKLRSTVGESMSGLRKDLKAAHDVVKVAKQKVMDVARALAKISPPKDLPSTTPPFTGTPSATTAPGI